MRQWTDSARRPRCWPGPWYRRQPNSRARHPRGTADGPIPSSSGDLRLFRLAVELGGEFRHMDVPATSHLEGRKLSFATLSHHTEGAETEQGSDLLGRGE